MPETLSIRMNVDNFLETLGMKSASLNILNKLPYTKTKINS